jgi:hypothetical protein
MIYLARPKFLAEECYDRHREQVEINITYVPKTSTISPSCNNSPDYQNFSDVNYIVVYLLKTRTVVPEKQPVASERL